ncbi:MAG: hypothetical protein WD035_09925 [Balneolaceae bacterium]
MEVHLTFQLEHIEDLSDVSQEATRILKSEEISNDLLLGEIIFVTEAVSIGLGRGACSMKAQTWPTIPVDHLLAAVMFAKKCDELEKRHKDDSKVDTVIRSEHRSYAISTIILTVAFLEATINDFFAGISNTLKNYETIADERILDEIKTLWNNKGIERQNMLYKYEQAFSILQITSFDKSKEPCQDVILLIDLRDELVHFKPEWILFGNQFGANEHKMAQRLRGKFNPNTLLPDSMPFYPDRCLGSSCTRWAIKSSVAFTDFFYQEIGLDAPYEKYRDQFEM